MQFRLRFWPTLGTVVGLTMLVSLGTWQFSRYQQKHGQEAMRDQRIDAQPQDVSAVDDLPGSYSKVRLHGSLDSDHLILFKHRTQEGKPGGWLGGVFRLEDGGAVLVNLGWIHREYYDDLSTDVLTGFPTTLSGLVHQPARIVADDDLRARLTDRGGLPEAEVVEADSYDLEAVQNALDTRTTDPPAIVVLAPEHARRPYPQASYDHVTQPYLTAERHLGYSVFWYMTGLALLGLYLAYGFGYLGGRTMPARSDEPSD